MFYLLFRMFAYAVFFGFVIAFALMIILNTLDYFQTQKYKPSSNNSNKEN